MKKRILVAVFIAVLLAVMVFAATGCIRTLIGAGSGAAIGWSIGGPHGAAFGTALGAIVGAVADDYRGELGYTGEYYRRGHGRVVGGFATFRGRECFEVKVFNGLKNKISLLADKEYILDPGGQAIVFYPVYADSYSVILALRVIDAEDSLLGTATHSFYIPGYNSRSGSGEKMWHVTSYHRAK